MDDKLKKVIERIKKCLALAQSDNPNEAATALRQAQKLMREYNLSENELKTSNVNEHRERFGKGIRKPPTWMNYLTAVCANCFDCERVLQTYRNAGYKEVVFIGIGEAPRMAYYAYEVLARQLNQARDKYVKEQREHYIRVPRTLANSFAIGWVISVGDKIESLKAKEETPVVSNEKALVIVANNLVKEYMNNNYKNIKKTKAGKDKIEAEAFTQGIKEGKKANLYQPMNNNSETSPPITAQ